MKRTFIILSNILVGLFFVWAVSIRSDGLIFDYYPSVSIILPKSSASYEQVKKGLDTLAAKTDSLIARAIDKPDGKNNVNTSYELFGQGKLPGNLKEATEESKKTASLVTNYYIFRGNLSAQDLAKELEKYNIGKCHPYQPTILETLARWLSGGFQLLGFLIFILTFLALTVIRQVREMRTAGVHFIAGESTWNLYLRSLLAELKDLLTGGILATVLSVPLVWLLGLSTLSLYFISFGLLFYNLVLFMVSALINLIFSVSLKRVRLMNLIKGKLPLRSIFALIFLCQLLALMIVSQGVNRTLIYTNAWREEEQGKRIWGQQSDLVNIVTNREASNIGNEEWAKQKAAWYDFTKEAVENQGALLVKHNLAMYMNGDTAYIGPRKVQIHDYDPEGNTLFVTPNYLDLQKVQMNSEAKERLAHLEEGQFGLVLPDKLKKDTEKYVKLYEDYMNETNKEGQQVKKLKAQVVYTSSGQKRFAYNNTSLSYLQFLKDPIMVVVTPKSMGPQSKSFWANALNSDLYFPNAEKTKQLLQDKGLYRLFSRFENSSQTYQTLLKKIQIEIYTTIASSILGIVTSLLLFNTMNLLYFAEFRREIFIKRVAGLGLWELHRSYLLIQGIIFLLGFGFSSLWTWNFPISFLVMCVFVGNSLLLLQRQMRKEERMASMILKGA